MYSEFVIALLKLILPKGGMQSFVVSFRFQPTLPFKKVYHKKIIKIKIPAIIFFSRY